MTYVEAVVILDDPIIVDPDLLGTVELGEAYCPKDRAGLLSFRKGEPLDAVAFEVWTPTLPRVEGGQAPLKSGSRGALKAPSSDGAETAAWSEVHWGTFHRGIGIIQALLFRAEHAKPSSAGYTLKLGAYDWTCNVVDWLMLSTGQILGHRWRPPLRNGQVTDQVSVRQINADSMEDLTWISTKRPRPKRRPPVTELDWKHAIEHASNAQEAKREVPLPYRLLLDAQAALWRENFDLAIIDASVAAEIVISHAARAHLEKKELPENVIRRVFGRRGITPLVEVALDLGLDVPKEAKKELAETRNRVVHGQRERNESYGAHKAVSLAGRIVVHLSPLDSHCTPRANTWLAPNSPKS